MARVRIAQPADPIPGVYSLENVYDWKYCDLCGSFNIGMQYRPRRTQTKIAIALLALVIASGVTLFAYMTGYWWTVLVGLLALCLGILIVVTPRAYLECRKCGNELISNELGWKFEGDPEEQIDVPRKEAMKEFVESWMT